MKALKQKHRRSRRPQWTAVWRWCSLSDGVSRFQHRLQQIKIFTEYLPWQCLSVTSHIAEADIQVVHGKVLEMWQ